MRPFYAAVISAVFLLSGCSSLRITSDYDRHFNFDTLLRIDVAYVPRDDGENFARERIVKQIITTLRHRGFDITDNESAALHIKIYLTVLQKSRAETRYDYVPAAFAGYYRPQYFAQTFYRQRYCNNDALLYRMNTTYDYDEQRLIVEIREAKKGDIVWHGVAVDTFSDNSNERYSNAYIQKLVEALLKDFPPH